MKKFRFLDWQVYKDSQKLFNFALRLVREMPKEYRFDLGSQLIRSSLSVVLNIAEGSGKSSDKELNRYFDISLGSLYEVLATVDTLRNNRLVCDDDFGLVLAMTDSISSQLGGFKKKIR